MVTYRSAAATLARAILGAVLLSNPTSAQIIWDWGFNSGADGGRIVTTGAPADLASPGTFEVLNLSLSRTSGSAIPGDVASGQYLFSGTIGAPPFSIEWDGAQVSALRDQNEFVGAPGIIEMRDTTSELMTQVYLGFNFGPFQGGLGLAEVATVNEIISTSTGAGPLLISPRPAPPAPGIATSVTVIAETKVQADSGSAFFASFLGRAPVINNEAEVAWVANVDNNPQGAASDLRLLRSDGEVLVSIAEEADPVDAGNQQFLLDFHQLQINDDGQVGFQADIDSPSQGQFQTSVIMRGDGSGAAARIVLDGENEPGADNAVFDTFETLSMNSGGQIAWRSDLENAQSSGGGIYRSGGGSITRIARAQRDGLADGSEFQRDFGAAVINNNGEVAFRADLTDTPGGATDDSGVFRGFNFGDATLIAREGDNAPGGNGKFDGFSDTGLNDQDDVAFVAQLRNTSGGATDDSGVYRGDAGSLVELARKGEPSPDGVGALAEFHAPALEGGPALNESGQVAVRTTLGGAGTTAANDAGILLTDGTTTVLVAREGAPAPGGGLFGDDFGDPALNDTGQLVFTSTLTGAGIDGSNDFGLYAFDPFRGVVQLFRESGGVDFGGDVRVIDDQGIRFDLDGLTTGGGRVAALLHFTDGVEAIVTTNIGQALNFPDLLGDYNRDGVVDAADFTLWRDTLGATGLGAFLGADGNGDGMITVADYQVWRNQFGFSIPTPAAIATPEPAAALLVPLCVGVSLRRRQPGGMPRRR